MGCCHKKYPKRPCNRRYSFGMTTYGGSDSNRKRRWNNETSWTHHCVFFVPVFLLPLAVRVGQLGVVLLVWRLFVVVIVLAGLQAQAVGDPSMFFLAQGPRLVGSAVLRLQREVLLEREQHNTTLINKDPPQKMRVLLFTAVWAVTTQQS